MGCRKPKVWVANKAYFSENRALGILLLSKTCEMQQTMHVYEAAISAQAEPFLKDNAILFLAMLANHGLRGILHGWSNLVPRQGS